MGEAVCLRCDWTGRTGAPTCPACGVALFRPLSGGPRVVRPGATPTRRANPEPVAERRRTFIGALAVAALLLIGIRVLSTWLEPPPEAPHRVVANGRLVYAVNGPGERQRLWTLDLATGRLRRGPGIRATSTLLAGWNEGSIAFASGDREGGQIAYLLRGLSPTDRPDRIVGGDRITWDPTGAQVIATQRGQGPRGCARVVAVTTVGSGPWGRDRVFPLPILCRDVRSVGPIGGFTYYTRSSGSWAGVFLNAGISSRRILPRHTLLSASPSGDLLVARVAFPAAAPTPEGADFGGPSELLPFGQPLPTPIGDGEADLYIERVLAWSADGGSAVVTGRLGELRGVFEIRTSLDHAPRHLQGMEVEAAGATFARDGTAYVAGGGAVYRVTSGEPVRMSLPDGAPAPAGPIVWLP